MLRAVQQRHTKLLIYGLFQKGRVLAQDGLDEMFTINELDLPASLKRCLGSTNIIESCFSGARGRTRRVTRWRNGKMVLRWAASALLATEKNFRRIIGYQSLPILEAKLAEVTENQALDKHAKVG